MVGAAFLYLAFLPPGIYSVDGNGMLAVAESLVAHHSLAVDPGLGLPGRGGLSFGKWYPLQSLLAVPFVVAAAVATHLVHLPTHYLAAILSLLLPIVFTAATVGLVGLIALQLGSSMEGALLASFGYAFGTIAMVYARTFYAEPLLAFLAAASIYLTLRGSERDILLAAAFAAAAVLAKPTGVLLAPALTSYLLARRRSLWLSLVPAAGSSIGLLTYFVYNQFRFGHALKFGQPWAFSAFALPHGIAGLLISPGRGLVWCCPVILLAFVALMKARKSREFLGTLLVTAVFIEFLVMHSLWASWDGGWSWGPRFLLPAIPGLAALLGLLVGPWRRAAIALTLMGLLVNAPTLFSFYERYYAELGERGVSEHDMQWSIEYTPFLHAWPAAVRQVSDARQADVRELFAQRGGSPAATISSSRALRIVALWWWVLPVAHIPRIAGVALSLLLACTGCWIVWKQAEKLRQQTSG